MNLIEAEGRRASSLDREGRDRRERPIRVAFVLHVMQVAGAEVLVVETIRRLAGRIEPTVICLDAVGPLGERLRGEGVEVACLGRRPGRDPRAASRMAAVLRRRGVEVVHAHQYTPFFYASLGTLAARRPGSRPPRVIFTEHGRHYPDIVSPLRRATNWLVFSRLAAAVNAVSGFSAESLRRVDGFAGQPIEVIENGIELERYEVPRDRRALRQRIGLDPERSYIANVARLHPIKDQAMLLRAFAEVAAARPDVDLLLVGDGALRGPLGRLAEELGVAGRVRFLGVRSDVPEVLAAVDIFALTSICEAASLTLLEAMASALPVVATAVGGTPEIVRDGLDGVLVPRGDAHATASAFLRLLGDPAAASAMGASARERVRARYQLARTIETYMDLYRRLAGRSDCAR
jgi:glycosyltransferase involved in cell wall biosynthesis